MVVLLWAPPSLAQVKTILLPGPLLSGSFLGDGMGYGAEISVMHGPTVYGVGGFSQLQWLTEDRLRLALGAQAGGVVGLETGWALVTEGQDSPRWSGPHLGLYGSIGIANLGLRLTIPVESTTGDLPDLDFALVFSLKVPLTLPEFELPWAHDRLYL